MHVALTHEHRFARCFCRGSGNTARWYFLHDNQKENTIPYGNLVFSFFAYTNRKVLSSFYKAAYAQEMLEEADIASTLKKLPTEFVRSCTARLISGSTGGGTVCFRINRIFLIFHRAFGEKSLILKQSWKYYNGCVQQHHVKSLFPKLKFVHLKMSLV